MSEMVAVGKRDIALVDVADYERVRRYTWSMHCEGYATAYDPETGRLVLMHRIIVGAKRGQVVDHANHDKLDNRRPNLRVGTQSTNMANGLRHADKVTSRFKGVYWNPDRKKWFASCANKYLGLFLDEEAAARAYDREARKRWGDCARTNFEMEE